MKWHTASPGYLKKVLDFLLPRESSCVALTSRFYRGSRDAEGGLPYYNWSAEWPGDNPFIAVLEDGDRIEGLIFISGRGLALPVFSERGEEELNRRALPHLIRRWIRKIHTCIGTRSVVSRIEEYRTGSRHRVVYFLMAQGNDTVKSMRYDNRIEIHRAGPRDLELLFPLYEAYEKEEVLLSPERFNKKFHRLLFERNLATQVLYYATSGGKPLGTAGTNAIGFGWCQLGSVFTLPRLRQKGIGKCLVSRVCREINREGKKACLYVKQDNPPAIALYRALGFEKLTEYQISYFASFH